MQNAMIMETANRDIGAMRGDDNGTLTCCVVSLQLTGAWLSLSFRPNPQAEVNCRLHNY
jgi:hypothetical protein